MNSKADIRARLLQRRRRLPPALCARWDDDMVRVLRRSFVPRRGQAVGAYLPLPGEPDVRRWLGALARRPVTLAVPVHDGNRWTWAALRVPLQLDQDPRHIDPQSLGGPVRPALALVPGVAFDRRGTRLGFGGGAYDRLLTAERPCLVVGVAYPTQIVWSLPTEPWDHPVDALATPHGVIWCTDARRTHEPQGDTDGHCNAYPSGRCRRCHCRRCFGLPRRTQGLGFGRRRGRKASGDDSSSG